MLLYYLKLFIVIFKKYFDLLECIYGTFIQIYIIATQKDILYANYVEKKYVTYIHQQKVLFFYSII